ncbi:MAG: AAA family ATPase [Alphaproteobacteria bacterium]
MNILALTSQKGGSGKTTLAGHLAVAAQAAGAGPVAVIDTDPQGSLTDWWNERQASTPAFLRASVATLNTDLARARDLGFNQVIVDTPPAITDMIEQVIALSDLIVIPTRPSPHDLRAAGTTIAMVESAAKPLVFVINAANPRARITGEAAVVLSQHGTVAPVTIHQRTDFAASMIDGRTVMELPRAGKSAEEISDLWGYLDGRLTQRSRPTIISDGFTRLAPGRANGETRWNGAS